MLRAIDLLRAVDRSAEGYNRRANWTIEQCSQTHPAEAGALMNPGSTCAQHHYHTYSGCHPDSKVPSLGVVASFSGGHV